LSAEPGCRIQGPSKHLEGAMTCIVAEPELSVASPNKWEVIRATVFWGFILLVIVSPGVLGTVILLRG
jgi:hypothetical protein